MTTLIDDALDAFIAAITPVTTTMGVTAVYEDRTQAYTHDDAPAINVQLTDASSDTLGDQHPARSVLRTTMQVDMAIYTRSAIDATGKEVSARKLAAPIWAAAHALLMADPSLGGRALRVRWRRSSWRKESADGAAGWATHTYELTLAMRANLLPAQ
jgi:hypothetical protein